jgi:hypothetical protein
VTGNLDSEKKQRAARSGYRTGLSLSIASPCRARRHHAGPFIFSLPWHNLYLFLDSQGKWGVVALLAYRLRHRGVCCTTAAPTFSSSTIAARTESRSACAEAVTSHVTSLVSEVARALVTRWHVSIWGDAHDPGAKMSGEANHSPAWLKDWLGTGGIRELCPIPSPPWIAGRWAVPEETACATHVARKVRTASGSR